MPLRRQVADLPRRVLVCAIGLFAVPSSLSAAEPDDECTTSITPRGSLSTNPSGVLLWGPSVSAEVGSRHLSLTGTYRFLGLGFGTTNSYYSQDVDTLGSFGVALRGNFYAGENLSGPQLGLSLEYQHTKLSDYGFTESAISHALVTAVHIGYRLPLQRFFLHPSTSLNYVQRVAGSSTEDGRLGPDYDDGSEVEGPPPLPDRQPLVGDVRIDIGFYF